MLPRTSFERIRSLKAVGSRNLHVPSVIGLRSDNRNPPISRPVGNHMFDDYSNVRLQIRITRILHLHHHSHKRENTIAYPSAANQADKPCGSELSIADTYILLLRCSRFLLASRKLPKLPLPTRDVMVASQPLPVGILVAGAQHMPEAPKIPPEDISEQQ